jgi:RNA polymerase sigma-70 factor (ECF subfamily)
VVNGFWNRLRRAGVSITSESLSGEVCLAVQTSDSELVARALHQDGAAWEVLVMNYQEPVFRLSYLLLGDADEAEDNTQETFLRAYHMLHRYDLDRPLRPWLLTIAGNLARNRRRSIGRYFGALQRLWQTEPRQMSTIEERSQQRSRSQSLWQAVQRLPPDHQQVIYLRYFLELPVEETAEALGTAPGTVKSRLHRAIDRLRQVIDADYPELKEFLE